MDRILVNSSTIVDIGYDDSSMTLELGFKQGAVYQYFDVPDAVYQELMRADSKGTFFHANIKNNYRYTKL
jgi:hypothetical protein